MKETVNEIKEIIFVTVSMGGGGTERVISVLANYYASIGKTVTILMIADNRIEYKLDDRIEVKAIARATGGNLKSRVERIINLRRNIKEQNGAGVIAMGTVTAMFTLLATLGLSNNVVISERNDPNRLNHKPIRRTVKLLRNILYLRAKAIVLQTEDVKECFPKCLVKKSVVIPNPLPRDLPCIDESTDREKTIITAGRLTEQKNQKLLIRAFGRIVPKYPEYILKIFGRGEMEKELSDMIRECRLEGKVYLKGFSDNLYCELAKGGIYVSTSNWEGISNSLAEALAMGIPTIATDCPMGGSRMLISNGHNGILIPVEDEDALVCAIENYISDISFRHKVSMKAIELREALSEGRIAGKWLECFEYEK